MPKMDDLMKERGSEKGTFYFLASFRRRHGANQEGNNPSSCDYQDGGKAHDVSCRVCRIHRHTNSVVLYPDSKKPGNRQQRRAEKGRQQQGTQAELTARRHARDSTLCADQASRGTLAAEGMAAMKSPWQFSLGYLLVEIFWIALALGFATQAIRVPPSPDANLYRSMLVLPAVVFAAAAVGGLLGRMDGGFYAAYGLLALGLVATIVLSGLFMLVAILSG